MEINMNIYTDKANQALKYAEDISRELQHSYIGTEHILVGLLQVVDSPASIILNNNKVNIKNVIDLIDTLVSPVGNVAVEDKDIFTPRVKKVLSTAADYANKTEDTKIGTEHILLALISEKDGVATRLLNTMGINLRNVFVEVLETMGVSVNVFKDEISEIFGDNARGKYQRQSNARSALNRFSVDLTQNVIEGKMDPVIGREDEIMRVIQILSRRTKNNPCLVGEPGVGKTSIVEAIARRIVDGNVPDAIRNKRVLTLDLPAMVAGSKYRGEFEERIKRVIEEVKEDGEVLLFIDEIHTMIGAGGAEGSMDAANILKPALARGEIQIIGATTLNEYRKYFEKDAALERRFQPVTVEEPEEEETIKILEGLKFKYEEHHNVVISDEAVTAAVTMSKRYINDRYLPDKAIDLMDEAAAKVKLSKLTKKDSTVDILRRLDELEIEKIDAIKDKTFKKAGEIKAEQEELKKKYDKLVENHNKTSNNVPVVKEDDVADVVSLWTKIPVAKLTEKESTKLKKLESTLAKRVVGQEEAVRAVANAIRRGRVGMKDPKRPTGSFLFLGPTGVGKTELSKALAEAVFGNENSIIRIDMSEYMEKHSVSKIIGSPPGYVGYDDGGQLSERVRRNPYSVVLFDEIEKAHPDVFNILLQVLDEGHITDNTGRKVDFRNTVIIMTSNVGAQRIIEPKQLGFATEKNEDKNYEIMKKGVMEEIKQLFKPEFLNRIDEIIVFRSLQKDDMKDILSIMLKEITDRAKSQLDINLKVSGKAKSVIIEESFDKKYGARPLRRKLQTLIEDKVAEEILEGNIKRGDTVNVGVSNGKLNFEVDKR
jgi:ATP-dependent Clp protease ATP-binding subunit ClpC